MDRRARLLEAEDFLIRKIGYEQLYENFAASVGYDAREKALANLMRELGYNEKKQELELDEHIKL